MQFSFCIIALNMTLVHYVIEYSFNQNIFIPCNYQHERDCHNYYN